MSFLDQLKNHKSLVVNGIFYFALALLIAIVLCYFIFGYQISLANQKINAVDQKLLVYATSEQKASEQEVFDYKKKIDDFTNIIANHKISSNVFSFMEKDTLPGVWFSTFNVSEVSGEISLQGEASTMEVLSNQVKIFEADKQNIKSINILSSQATLQGTTKFTLDISLTPDVFKDTESNPN